MFAYLYILKLLAANNFTFKPIKSKEKVALFKLLYVKARRATLSLILDSSEKYFFPYFTPIRANLRFFTRFCFEQKVPNSRLIEKKFGHRLEFSESEKRRRNPGVVETEDQEDRGSNRSDRRWVFTAGFYADTFTS